MPLVNRAFADLFTFARASTVMATSSAGVLTSIASGSPAFDYDPVTLAARGLLIQEQRTSIHTYNQQFDNAAWTKITATITADATTAPDGTTTADKLVEDATAATAHYILQAQAVTSGTSYTESVFAKAGERSQVAILLGTSGFGANVVGIFTLSGDGTASLSVSGTASSVKIEKYPDGWYRCSLTSQATASASPQTHIRLASGGVTAYDGDGASGLYIWGDQFEAGTFATSYMGETTSASITRLADSCTITGAAFSSWFGAAAGTLVLRGRLATASAFDGPILLTVSDGSTNNRHQLYKAPSSLLVRTAASGVASNNTFAGYSYTEDAFVAGFSYGSGKVYTSLNGGAVTETTQALPSSIDRLVFGSVLGVPTGRMWLSELSFIPSLKTGATLQALTA